MANTFEEIQNGQYTSNNRKKKKKYESTFDAIQDGSYEYKPYISSGNNSQQSTGFFDNILNLSAFDDGYQFGDVSKTLLGTTEELFGNLKKGAVSNLEGLIDAGANLVSGAVDDNTAKKIREWTQKDFINNSFIGNAIDINPFGGITKVGSAILNGDVATLNPFDKEARKRYEERINQASISGDKLDNLEQGVGQLAGQVALNSVGVPWQLTAFASSMGQEMNNAFQNNANYGQALLSGIISGGAEVLSENIFGGGVVGKALGIQGIGEKAINKLGSKIGNKVIQLLVKRGLDMASEGAEEVISGYLTALGQQLTYMSDKEINELYSTDQALEDFINGALISGVANVGGDVMKASTPQGRKRLLNENAFTGMTDNEQKVYDRLINDETKKALDKNDGKKLTKKQINQIEENVREQMSNGRVNVDYIEDTLGFGDRVNYLVNEAENSFARELNEEERLDIENQAREEILDTMGNDYILQESYLQDQLRRNKFEMDMSKVDEKLQDFYQKAIDSGMLNNTRDTHNFVDMLAKIHKDKGIEFDFTNNEKLAESGFALDGKTVNGYITDNGITLNLNSKNALESTVGHEITHVLEGTDMYDALAKSIKEYAESKGEYAKRLKEVQDLYKDVENADATKELTADLVGDYLFTNQEFINHLTQNRNLFQKIYDEIKYLVKQVTAGSKEQRKLNKAMKMFEKAYRENSIKLAEQEASAQPKFSITTDSTGKELSKEQLKYFKDSKIIDNEGRLKVMYHGTPTGGFNIFDPNNPQRDVGFLGKGFYFTENIEDADEYSKDFNVYDYTDKSEVKEVYLNIKKPYIIPADTPYQSDMLAKLLGVKTNEIQSYLIKKGYDGIIYNNPAHSEIVAFYPEQIKNVDNTNPTDNPDIRYSLSSSLQDSNINTTTDINNDFFKEHESDFDKNNGKSHILYDNYGNKIEQTTNVYKLEKGNNLAKLSTTLEQNVDDNYGKLYIDELYVKNKSEGLGTEIINSLKQYAKENNLEIHTMKELGNPKTQKFWNSVTEQDFGLDKTSRQLYSYYQPGYNISKTDSTGKKLSYEQRQYFKDSKVVDKNRNLQVVYHQTNNEFTEFKNGYSMRGFKNANFFTNQEPKQVLKHMMKGYVNITNPLYLENTSIQQNIVDDAIANGYDGIINQNVQGIEGKNEIVTFNSNQIKNVDNTNPTDNADIRYSLSSTDSNGRELTEQQQELFKDSKNRTPDGRLRVMYRGGNEDFNIFDRTKANPNGQQGNGFYFTTSKDHAMQYGTPKEYYLNIVNPLEYKFNSKPKTITKEQLHNLVESMYNNEDYSMENYGSNATIDSVTNDLYSKDSDYDMLMDLNMTAVGNMAEFVEYVNNTIGTNYDGIITDYETVVFNSNQIKSVDNKAPTDNPDIRYSLTKKVDTELDELTDEQYEYFKNTKAVDNEGELEVVYHGTPHEFSVFDIEKAGETGLAFGNGFYFTNSKGSAMGYTDGGLYGDSYDQVKEGYINIEKPASRDTKTMTYNEFYNLYNALNENPNMYDEEMGMSNIDALLSDYGDIYNDKENTIKKFYDSYDDDVSLIDNLSYIGNPTEMYKTLRDVTGYDGIIPENPNMYDSFEKIYIAFNPDQFKLKSNKTPTDNVDMNLSLSRIDDIAPVKNPNLTYGEDVAYQEEIAPYQQLLENLQEDIQNIKEDYRKQAEDIKKELQALREEREELDRGYNEVAPMVEYEPVESNMAPYESENTYYNENVPTLTDDELKKYKNYFKNKYALKGKQLNEAMENIKELSAKPDLTRQDVYKYFKDNFGKEEIRSINQSIVELKNELRNTPIGITDDIKSEINYRHGKFNNFKKKYFGKLKLVNYDGFNGLDQVYQELADSYPELLNEEEISNPADQLMQLAEITDNPGYISVFENVPEELIKGDADELYSMIKDYRNETNQELAEEQAPLSYLEDIAPIQEEDTVDNYYNDLNQRIATLEDKLNNLSREESVAIQMREFDENNKYRIKPTKKDIMDLFHQEIERKNGKKVELTKPVIAKEKSSLRSGLDTLSTMFVNQNTEIDNLAKESGNKNIKFAGDMLNNYSAEAQNDVAVAQTDNYGNAIGKSVQQLFEPAKAKGLEAAFNDYLINYSNIDRWARGKGSQTPVDVSERLVKNYEEQHPEFKRWAKDVWKFGENVRKNWLEAGMIKQEMFDLLSEAYPHYVPYISDTNNFDAAMDKLNELKARPIKRAVGGATELFPVEEALTRYTFAQKRAYRQNELFKQIYNTLQTNPGQRGADVGEGYFTGEEPNLYRDDSGNYITALFDGEEHKIQVSDDLFKSLRNDMQTQIKDLENKLSIITKPLQTASNIRRKMLTSWSPSFTITNPLKDIQDAFFNSKHLKGMAKNYIPGIKELWTGSTPEARQFLALYGEGNLMGQFENESGLYDAKKGAKNGKFLKGLSKVNNIMELAPRYAEFKASLQAGESLAESMYNAREITTNFSRGGVITKALNRNGFTFLNASVQGFDKFLRNFSGENGARGIASSLLRAAMLGVAPAVFNELAFGSGDDKDEDYDALPDYIKDNYYIIKLGKNQGEYDDTGNVIKIGGSTFLRIPKGRMLSVFGSAARRTIELAEGEEDAFEGYLSNVNNQIGINNPEENNIFSPLIQAYGSENGTAWYGGDIVPTRLQDKPKNEQYDASTDKFSIWLSNTALGKKMGLSPYKVNYVIDQYTGGIGDILLPMITDEATSNGSLLAPVTDKFTADSTTDNKYVSDFYTKNDELKVKANSSKATDDDYLRNQYMYNMSKEMGKLYAERRDIQADNSLSKSEKYEKSQAIKEQINKLAKHGLDSYDNISRTGNFAQVGDDMGYYKNAKGNWTPIDQKDIIATESIGLTDREKSTYYGIKNDMYNIDQKYEPKLKTASDEEKTVLNAQKKVDIINSIKNANLPDEAKAKLYDKKYASTETLDAVINCGIDFDSYLDLQAQNFTADKNIYGKTINGSKKRKVYSYINNLDMPYEQKIMLAKLEYKSDDTYNREIINYLNNDNSISYQDMTEILKAMGFKVDEYGNITWE